MDAPSHPLVRRILAVAVAMKTCLRAGAEAYANGNGRARPIVASHFTTGNQQRYGWPPLSRDYFLAKQRGIRTPAGKVPATAKLANGQRVKTGTSEFQSRTGELVGIGSGANLPMLVKTGKTRQAIAYTPHPIDGNADGSIVTIHFGVGAPEWARYLETGTSRMPRRSPVDLNDQDRREVLDTMKRHMSAAMGSAGAVSVSQTSVPGRARLA